MNSYSQNIDEKNLITQIKKGNKKAFELLMKKYNKRLYGYLMKMLKQNTLVDDAVQETFIKVWTKINYYKDENKFASWLFTIAHNIAIDEIRKSKSNANFDESFHSCSTSQVDVFKQTEDRDLIDQMNQIVESLPLKQKDVFLLRQNAELTFREIAIIRNEPINTVLSHMNYAVKKIKKHMQENNVY